MILTLRQKWLFSSRIVSPVQQCFYMSWHEYLVGIGFFRVQKIASKMHSLCYYISHQVQCNEIKSISLDVYKWTLNSAIHFSNAMQALLHFYQSWRRWPFVHPTYDSSDRSTSLQMCVRPSDFHACSTSEKSLMNVQCLLYIN